MDNLTNWMTDKFAPKVNKIVKNPWIASIQESILTGMPMIFIGSFVTVLSLVRDIWPAFPDFSLLSTFSFGLFSLFMSYLLPEAIMNNKGYKSAAKPAGLAGIAFFLMLVYPTIDDGKGIITLTTAELGTGGMLVALVAGLFVGLVMTIASKYQLIGEDSALPDFVAAWFNTILPITLILLVGWIFTFQMHFNMSAAIMTALQPLVNIGGSFGGFVLIVFLGYSFLYSFGISSWIIYPVEIAIALPAIAENARNAANGLPATNIFTEEVVGMFVIGGGGATLALCIMMTFMAKSSRMKIVGRAAIIPSIFNINEPVVFGAPIAFNPTLMIPMWIMGLLGPISAWIVMRIGLVPIPEHVFDLWYLPAPIFAYISTNSINGLIYTVALFVISWFVYLPFFKVYDKQAILEEAAEEA
ncbi:MULTISPECIES: PTS sugar transporter subunit IIC [Enterococcus]|uniref:Permease IIC component n=1 Tax=Enterococcus alishanensis TaxID=1303817 RepID=A0ABS6TA05_9ENTE|nr:PTS transporter subunit EIIC [Enterococcus alishanensis]MBV7389743.1 PTS transporter subunit EIIC [Enterococcus alishanensis]